MKDDGLFEDDFGIVPNHEKRWWKLWWWNSDFKCYAYRYKWMRDFMDKIKVKG